MSSSASKVHQGEPAMSATVKDQLQLMLPHLEKDIADLVCNATPLYDMFLVIREELSQDLLTVLLLAVFIAYFYHQL